VRWSFVDAGGSRDSIASIATAKDRTLTVGLVAMNPMSSIAMAVNAREPRRDRVMGEDSWVARNCARVCIPFVEDSSCEGERHGAIDTPTPEAHSPRLVDLDQLSNGQGGVAFEADLVETHIDRNLGTHEQPQDGGRLTRQRNGTGILIGLHLHGRVRGPVLGHSSDPVKHGPVVLHLGGEVGEPVHLGEERPCGPECRRPEHPLTLEGHVRQSEHKA
jgi:hypothetical protein